MRILVTGANGQLGMTFQAIAPEHPEHEFFFCTSKELNITDVESLEAVFHENKPEVVINCAAYTAVDLAEDEPEKAYTVNGNGVKNLVDACQKTDSALIHISTDYVFDGIKEEPYMEEDEPNPINVYGESKLAGEKHVLTSNLKAIILRTSWVYSEFGNNFVKTMLRLGKERETLNVVNDQFGSPTYARDLAEVCLSIIDQYENWNENPTVFHYSNEGVISWYEFAQEIMNAAELNCEVSPVPTESYPTKARRPKYSTLSKSAICNRFNIESKNWRTSLQHFIK